MASGRTNYMDPSIDPASSSDIRIRNFVGGNHRAIDYSRYGIMSDTSRLQERIEGRPSRAPNNSYKYANSGGSYNFGKSNTGNDPGAGNWSTYERNLNRAVDIGKGLVNYRMENKRNAKAKAFQNRLNSSANATAARWASSNNLVQGDYDPIGGRKDSLVNLLTPLGPPPSNTPSNSRRPTRPSPYSGPQPPSPPTP